MPSLRSSEPIAGYTVKERVGAGGYGEVWTAEVPGGLVKAIKFVYGYLDDDRASRELKALNRIKQVRHPFLLSIERIEVVDGQLMIVTELAEMSLKDRFEQCRAERLPGIPREELLIYLGDAADALDFMRVSHSLQHLDVKPENLLLLGGRVKVADFGLVKDIGVTEASLMGGMTPVYAPPEVFDDRPGEYSDQYSLAIVYQEMLTGVLPFPGKTAAQLATQHLQSPPRLASLPPHDRAVIERALSKVSNHRFPSCRELIDLLIVAPKARAAAVAATPLAESAPADEPGMDSSTCSRTQLPAAKSTPQVTASRTQIVGDTSLPQIEDREWDEIDLTPVEVENLPPLDVATAEQGFRPTLVVGIGGGAAHVFARLRRRLYDRFGDLRALPALRTLLIDTDVRAFDEAADAEKGVSLEVADTFAMPLRKPEDYRADSTKLLQWLSRRWLYNIPRSLETEGLRPLGRLAFVDHGAKLRELLRTQLTRIADPAVADEFAERTGWKCRDPRPRIILLSSISGGTGGGCAIDVMYMLRVLIHELHLSEDGLCSVFMHATGMRSRNKELAAANARAFLTELSHCGRGHYPGELALKIPAFQGQAALLPPTYLVNLGERINEQDYENATDAVAEYLYQDVATLSGALLDQSRMESASSTSLRSHRNRLRSFGVTQIGAAQGPLPSVLAEKLCSSLVRYWRGETTPTREARANSLLEFRLPDAEKPVAAEDTLSSTCAEHAKQHEVEYDQLCAAVIQSIDRTLGGDRAAYWRNTVERLNASETGAASEPLMRIRRAYQAINAVLGNRKSAEAVDENAVTLTRAVEAQMSQFATHRGQALQQWLTGLAESPGVGARGAEQAIDWFHRHLSACEQRVVEQVQMLRAQMEPWDLLIQQTLTSPAAQGKTKAGTLLDQPMVRLGEYFEIRLREVGLSGLHLLVRQLLARVTSAQDQLKSLRKDLNELSAAFDATPAAVDAGALSGPMAAVRVAANDYIRHRLTKLTEQFDADIRERYLNAVGGVRASLEKRDLRPRLPGILLAEARRSVLRALSEFDVAKVLVEAYPEEAELAEQLQQWSALATPGVLAVGGAKRLFLAAPAGEAANRFASAMQQAVGEIATVVPNPSGDLVLFYEAERLPLERVATLLSRGYGDCGEVAERLYTRIDVEWPSLDAKRVPAAV
ncbi:MAG: tubulin-like doman-containing protein [Planctomycetia bacterium]|nr:tubulin-like doman-containing protein [Planctomycetia bacterium]